MTDESTKRRILARRAQLVAAALSAVACSPPPETKPSVCLEPIILPPEDSGSAGPANSGDVVPPQPCLSPMPPDPPDAGPADSGAPAKDAGVKDSGVKPPPPHPCLSPVTRPTVCLKPMQPPPNVCLYIKK